VRAAVLLAFAAVALNGCAARADAPPEPEPQITVPDVAKVSAHVPAAVRIKTPTLARDSAERRARTLTVRIRNVSCQGIGTGSGFALTDDVLVTNRHVLAGAKELEVSTWDGRTLAVDTAFVGVLGDLGIAIVSGKLPRVGTFGPPPVAGDSITAVGYPLGGPLTLSTGTVVDRTDGSDFGVPGQVVRLTANVLPGNSGGPVLDRKGRIAAIVYAIEIASGFGLAIPVDTLRHLIDAGGFEDITACGYQ
jgi:S1-C subfamily serine protease